MTRINKLSASRYRPVENEEEYFEKPNVTLDRLMLLVQVIGDEVKALKGMLE